MALVVYWYDCVCFGIVAAAFVGSLWVLWRKEGASSRCEDESVYESLVGEGSEDDDGFVVRATPRAHVGSNQLWTSCWKRVHPGWLLLTRSVSFAVLAGFLAWDLLEWDASIFVYYTEWTFALVMVYFALGIVSSAYGCFVCLNTRLPENSETDPSLKRDVEDNRAENCETNEENGVRDKTKLQGHHAQEKFQQRAGFWGYLMQTIYQTCAGAVILTDIVFWCVIVPFLSTSRLGLNTLMGCMHTLNAGFLILDTLLNSLPFPWFRLAYFVEWSCLYVVFQWVLHACGFTWWPYPFLELNTQWAPLWYFAMAVVHIPCYGMYALIVKAKNSILPKLFPHAFVRSY